MGYKNNSNNNSSRSRNYCGASNLVDMRDDLEILIEHICENGCIRMGHNTFRYHQNSPSDVSYKGWRVIQIKPVGDGIWRDVLVERINRTIYTVAFKQKFLQMCKALKHTEIIAG